MLRLIFLLCLCHLIDGNRDLLNPCDAFTVQGKNVFRQYFTDRYTFMSSVPTWFDRNLQYENCSRRGLLYVPRLVASEAEILDLSFNLIRRVGAHDFDAFAKVVYLKLTGNCVKNGFESLAQVPACDGKVYIKDDAFRPLVNLKMLDLDLNFLHRYPNYLPSSILFVNIGQTSLQDETSRLKKTLASVEVFYAAYNCVLTDVTDGCPGNFTISGPISQSLRILELSGNNWTAVPSYLFGKKLQFLSLSSNPINKLKKNDFKGAENLVKLDLAGMFQPVQLELGVFDGLVQLEVLYLVGNAIEFIPLDIFKNNKKLTHLDLSMNCLIFFILDPVFLVGLTKLTHLDLSFNGNCGEQVHASTPTLRLGQSYANLTSLESFVLGAYPEMTRKVTDVGAVVEIQEIDKFSFSNLENLDSLAMLSLSFCGIRQITQNALSRLRYLTSILISGNKITSFNSSRGYVSFQKSSSSAELQPLGSKTPICRNASCEYVSMAEIQNVCQLSWITDYSNNWITSVHPGQIPLIPSVTNLDLSYNLIQIIYDGDFRYLPYLCRLNLANNPLKMIETRSMYGLSFLQDFNFGSAHGGYKIDLDFMAQFQPSKFLDVRWLGQNTEVFDSLIDWHRHNRSTNITGVSGLDITGNQIQLSLYVSSKSIFATFVSLEVLTLRKCSILTPLPQRFLFSLPRLVVLDMSDNLLREIPVSEIRPLTKLVSLNFDRNSITRLSGDVLSHLPNLQIFSAIDNKISYISANFFGNATLSELNLSQNRIKDLDASVFTKALLLSVQLLDLRWNELDCSCGKLNTFYLWYRSDVSLKADLPGFLPTCSEEIDEYFGGCIACYTPSSLRGLSLARYGFNTSCDLFYAGTLCAVFASIMITFLLAGLIIFSKWFKRLIFRHIHEAFRIHSVIDSDENPLLSRYHAFLLYDHENAELGDWVDDLLIPAMNNGFPSLAIKVSGRDNSCGVAPTQQLMEYVIESRKTIVLLSDKFCQTPKCKLVLSAIQEMECSEQTSRMILVAWNGKKSVKVPEVAQRTRNKRNSSLLYFDSFRDDPVLFFEALRSAVICNYDS
ncbi:unnamed protein product [Clavelina lepadiformis]|uniref:TIR domain-containing protein n=1 Tax=Clavelina lepadiformis TaxID=159417 RepID=A0ABP0GDJ6_CLALP